MLSCSCCAELFLLCQRQSRSLEMAGCELCERLSACGMRALNVGRSPQNIKKHM